MWVRRNGCICYIILTVEIKLVFSIDWRTLRAMGKDFLSYSAVALLGLVYIGQAVAESEVVVPPVEKLDTSMASYDFNWRSTKFSMQHDDIQYGFRLNRGELTIKDDESSWKTTFDLPDQQIKVEIGF